MSYLSHIEFQGLLNKMQVSVENQSRTGNDGAGIQSDPASER